MCSQTFTIADYLIGDGSHAISPEVVLGSYLEYDVVAYSHKDNFTCIMPDRMMGAQGLIDKTVLDSRR